MKTLFFLVVVCVTLSGCRTVKDMSSTSEVHHIKDSVNIVHLQIIDTIYVPSQKIDGSIPIDILKQLGEYSISKNGLTTKLIYIHDTLEVETIKDSSLILSVNQLWKEYRLNNTSQNTKSNVKTTIKQPLKSKKHAPFWLILILVLSILITIYLIILKFKR